MGFDALDRLGWSPAWAAARAAADMPHALPYRLARLAFSRAQGLGAEGAVNLALSPTLGAADLAVGDWVLAAEGRICHLLPRQTLLARRAAGTGAGLQRMAANVDVMLIVTACGSEFNPARLERYLVLAHASATQPVIVLTKADLLDPAPYLAQARACAPSAPLLALNGKTDAAQVLAHIQPGNTAVLMGSSGVGKSTLANGLLGGQIMATAAVRPGDQRGRHTTTARHLLELPQGGWLIDTPGLREVQLADVAGGLDNVFGDIMHLARQCRFRNCRHQAEPGCAVQAAVAQGQIDAERLARWRKLSAELEASDQAVQAAQTRALGRHTRKSASKHRPPPAWD
jgi:ribosome biogenesis GTPase / thiamine phosphate phosphatase